MVVGTADRNLIVFNLQNPQVMFFHLMHWLTDICYHTFLLWLAIYASDLQDDRYTTTRAFCLNAYAILDYIISIFECRIFLGICFSWQCSLSLSLLFSFLFLIFFFFGLAANIGISLLITSQVLISCCLEMSQILDCMMCKQRDMGTMNYNYSSMSLRFILLFKIKYKTACLTQQKIFSLGWQLLPLPEN